MEKRFEKEFKKATKTFKFVFVGSETKENIDYEKLDNLLDNCFTNFYNSYGVVNNISWIRTILRDFEETYLKIECYDTIDCIEGVEKINSMIVEYEDKDISYYESRIDDKEEDATKYIKYESGVLSSNYFSKKALEIELDKFKDISTASAKEISQEGKTLYEIYKLFYGETPDFSSKDIQIKMQAMMVILSSFGISIDEYCFHKQAILEEIPSSLILYQDIYNMIPFGRIEKMSCPIQLNEQSKKIVEIVGQEIRKYISVNGEEIKNLINISNMIDDN